MEVVQLTEDKRQFWGVRPAQAERKSGLDSSQHLSEVVDFHTNETPLSDTGLFRDSLGTAAEIGEDNDPQLGRVLAPFIRALTSDAETELLLRPS